MICAMCDFWSQSELEARFDGRYNSGHGVFEQFSVSIECRSTLTGGSFGIRDTGPARIVFAPFRDGGSGSRDCYGDGGVGSRLDVSGALGAEGPCHQVGLFYLVFSSFFPFPCFFNPPADGLTMPL